MNIVMITTNDPAGTAIQFSKAINRCTEHRCRLITTEIRYNHLYEKDIHIPWLSPKDFEEVETLLEEADLFHFHMLTDETIELGHIKVKDYVNGHTVVHHHHGHHQFRGNPLYYREKYRRLKRPVLVSTPDLLRLLPDAEWQPNLVPIHEALFRPSGVNGNGTVRVGQAPTRKELKNTSDLIDVVARQSPARSGRRVELDIIENCQYQECLKRKNRCHIIFDHMQGYYGVSSLESLSQGKPVIAGLDDWNQYHIREFSESEELPWVIAHTREDLEAHIEEMALDEALRQRKGEESRRFMENHWTEEQVVNRLVRFYESL